MRVGRADSTEGREQTGLGHVDPPPRRCRRGNAGPGRVPRPFCVLEKPWRRKASDQEPEGLAEKRELHGLDLGDRLAGSEEQVQEIPRRCERRCSVGHAGREARTPS